MSGPDSIEEKMKRMGWKRKTTGVVFLALLLGIYYVSYLILQQFHPSKSFNEITNSFEFIVVDLILSMAVLVTLFIGFKFRPPREEKIKTQEFMPGERLLQEFSALVHDGEGEFDSVELLLTNRRLISQEVRDQGLIEGIEILSLEKIKSASFGSPGLFTGNKPHINVNIDGHWSPQRFYFNQEDSARDFERALNSALIEAKRQPGHTR